MPLLPKRVFIILIWLALMGMACNLAIFEQDTPTPEAPAVDTSNWVAYVGRGVQIGAPPNGWLQIPFDLPVALEQQTDLESRDPTVANVYRGLVLNYVREENTRLLLMRLDGTAWLVVRRASLVGTTFEERVQTIQQNLRAQGAGIQDEQSLRIGDDPAIRWESATSPPGSQVVNRQLHYAIHHEASLYYLLFSAQAPDYPEYRPAFYTMADSLLIFE